jgi:uncharacterized Tic20 family protein
MRHNVRMTEANPYAAPAAQPPLSPADEKQWAILTHVIGIFFGIISAAVFFFLYRDRGPFVRSHVVAEWNFRLTVTALTALVMVFSLIGWGMAFASALTVREGSDVAASGIAMFMFGWFGMVIIQIVSAILGIVASVAASRGRHYRFPGAIPFVRR